jgi:hypothetical protein
MTTTTTRAPTSTTTTTTAAPAKLFTLTNTGEVEIEIQSMIFKDPMGIGHITDLSNLGGGKAVVGDSILSCYLDVDASVTFTVVYYNLSGLAGAPAGNYTGTIVINSSDNTTQNIVNKIIVNSRTIITTTTRTPTTTTTTAVPTSTTTTTAAPTSTTTTTLPPGVTTTTQAPTSTTTTTTPAPAPVDPRANWVPVYGTQEGIYQVIFWRDSVTGQVYNYDGTPYVPFNGNSAGGELS